MMIKDYHPISFSSSQAFLLFCATREKEDDLSEFKTNFDGTEEIFSMPQKSNKKTFIYVLLDDDENILYVGQSTFPEARVWNHRLSKEFTKYKFFECDPRKVNNIELRLYLEHSPKYNKIAPVDPDYDSLDNYKIKNPELRGKIKKIRKFISGNPVDTLGGLYPVEYLDRLKMEVSA